MHTGINKIVWHMFHELFYLLILPLDLLVPKRKDYWIFALKHGIPWGDNLRNIFERALEDPDITPILLTNGSDPRDDIKQLYADRGIDIITAKRMSLRGVGYFLRSKFCFISFSNMELYSVLIPQFRHNIINLWHGIRVKAVGFALPKKRNYRSVRKFLNPHYIYCDYYISSSEVDKLAMCTTMMHNPHKVWVTGSPRNDYLFEETRLPPDLQAEDEHLKKVLNGRKLVLYSPTFREWRDNVNPISDEKNAAALAKLAEKYGAVFGIRKHWSDHALQIVDGLGIIDCGNKEFPNSQIVIRNADIMISDYSSIWVDYLLLNRPVIGYCYDYERYLRDRSLLFRYDNIFPGEITYNFDELVSALESVLKGEESADSKALRKSSRKFFFSHFDNQSTTRVYTKIQETYFGKKCHSSNN